MSAPIPVRWFRCQHWGGLAEQEGKAGSRPHGGQVQLPGGAREAGQEGGSFGGGGGPTEGRVQGGERAQVVQVGQHGGDLRLGEDQV